MVIKKIKKNKNIYKTTSLLGQFFFKKDIKCSENKVFNKIYKKTLFFEGLGFEVFFSQKKKFLNLKLSLSHLYSIKIPKGVFILIPNNKTLIAYSFSNLLLSSWISSIKLIKKPNSFKKKGIFYENEKIILKKGKSSK
jgi:ribosomal protein L6P/L9E